MLLVSAISNQKYKLLVFLLSAFSLSVIAQENSVYSRYGLGNIVPNASIANRGMAGLSAAYVDYDKRFDLKEVYPKSQSVNFLNPASYSKQRITTFDLGFEIDNRTLHATNGTERFTSTNAIISYVQLAIPLSRKHNVGMNLGLRPVRGLLIR